jgi:DNA-binding MarR family transcriptional regulator
MKETDELQETIEKFWETIPPVWGFVRGNARSNAVKDFNVTLIQFHILRHIRAGAHSVAELAERQQISRPAVSQAVDLLVEKGLVTRSQGLKDRRYVQVDLTGKGNEMLTDVFSKSRHWMAEKMAALTPDELQTITQALAILKTTFLPSRD